MKKLSLAMALTLAAGVSLPAFAQTNPTAGTTNSDVTAETTTGASSTMAGHHTKSTMKHHTMKKHSTAMGAKTLPSSAPKP